MILVGVSLTFRALLINNPAFWGADAYVHYGITREFMRNGITDSFPLSGYPEGVNVYNPILLYVTPLVFHSLINSFGVALFDSFRFLPVLFGVAEVLTFYFLIKELFSERVSFIAAFLLAVNGGHLSRTLLGSFRGETFALLFFLLFLFFWVRGLKRDNKWLVFLSGFIGSLGSLFWSGHIIFYGISLVLLFWLSTKRTRNKHFALLLFSYLTQNTLTLTYALFNLKNFSQLTPIFMILSLIIYAINKLTRKQKKKTKIIIYAILTLPAIILTYNLTKEYHQYIIPTNTSILTTIQETNHPTIITLWTTNHLCLILFPLSPLAASKKTHAPELTITLIIISTLLLFATRRFVFLASPGITLAASLGATRLAKNKKQWHTALLFVSTILSYQTISLIQPINTDLLTGLNWIRENTRPDEVFLSSWEVSSYIIGISERKVMFDSVNQKQGQIMESATFLLSNRTRMLTYYGTNNIDYLVITKGMLENYEILKKTAQPGTIPQNQCVNETNLYKLFELNESKIFRPVYANEEIKIFKK